MNETYRSEYHETEQRRELLEAVVGNPEIGMTARLAQQFGHVAIRHAKQEISTEDHDYLYEVYIDKLAMHSLTQDRKALGRNFNYWIDAMYPASLADIYDAKIELESATLPEFVAPDRVTVSEEVEIERLRKENAAMQGRLAELEGQNLQLLSDALHMRRVINNKDAEIAKLTTEPDELFLDEIISQQEEVYSRGSLANKS